MNDRGDTPRPELLPCVINAKLLAHEAEAWFERMQAYAASDPERSVWVSAYAEGFAMRLCELIVKHRNWAEDADEARARTIVSAMKGGADVSESLTLENSFWKPLQQFHDELCPERCTGCDQPMTFVCSNPRCSPP